MRLATFNIPQYARMTMVDEMDFGSLGEKKKAIFCVIPVDDSSMNYLVGMLYTQCFQALYRRADEKHNGRLPVPVRVIQDEWANVAQPESYPKILATCRSYNIGLNIIVQNIQQIKALYEKEWESIIGNCDTLLFLGGGNEPTSLEFIVKLLGKETIATRTRGQTKGRSGSSSTNFQQTGRDLMTIDEVRKLDTHKAILFIRGEDPVLDKKYNIKRHPNIKLTTDGKAKPYNWIVENLTNAFGVWNSKMTEMWSLLTESPQTFKGGTIWQTIVTINGGMQAIGYGLLVLFFAIGIFRSASGFRDFQRPEHLLRHFIYFVLAKLGITYGMDLLVNIFDVCNGIVATAAGSIGGLTGASVALPQEIADAIGDVGFLASIPLWLVTLLGSLMITVLAFIMILTVYGRFFKIYMYAALSPVALASFAGEGTSHFGKAFLRSYVGVCMEGAVIVLACIIFSAFSSSGTPVVDSSASVVTQVWSYLGEVVFNLLVLVGLVKSADHIAKEMLGL